MKRFYDLHKNCMVQITVKTDTGDYATGAGFHIGDGYLVIVRHLIDKYSIEYITGNYTLMGMAIKRILYPPNPLIDLALLETNFSLQHFMEKCTIIDGSGVPNGKDRFHSIRWSSGRLVR